MTSEPDDLQQASFKAAAAQWLGVPADAPPAEVRTALLHKIKEAEFVPPPGLIYAAELLGAIEPCGTPQNGPSERVESFTAGCEQALREDVEQFAARFFSIPVPQRREQFFELQNRAEDFPRLKSRLQILEHGLIVDLDVLSDETPQLIELAQRAAALHVLRPHARAELRQKMFADLVADARNWDKLAASLERNWPELSLLVPDFIPPLAQRAKQQRQLAAKQKRLMKQGVRIVTTTRPATSSRLRMLLSSWPAIAVLIGITTNLVRTGLEQSGKSHAPDRYYTNPYQVPNTRNPYKTPDFSTTSSPASPESPASSTPSPPRRQSAPDFSPFRLRVPALQEEPPTGGGVLVPPQANAPITVRSLTPGPVVKTPASIDVDPAAPQTWTPPALPPPPLEPVPQAAP